MRKGITLIEIVVFIAIILIMIVLLVPAINQVRNYGTKEINTEHYEKLSILCSKNELIKQRTKFFMSDGKISTNEYRELITLEGQGKNILLESLKGN